MDLAEWSVIVWPEMTAPLLGERVRGGDWTRATTCNFRGSAGKVMSFGQSGLSGDRCQAAVAQSLSWFNATASEVLLKPDCLRHSQSDKSRKDIARPVPQLTIPSRVRLM